jgi:hypothetical protein
MRTPGSAFATSWVLIALHPRVRAEVDPRIDLYAPDIYDDWTSARDTLTGFFAYLDRYDIASFC